MSRMLIIMAGESFNFMRSSSDVGIEDLDSIWHLTRKIYFEFYNNTPRYKPFIEIAYSLLSFYVSFFLYLYCQPVTTSTDPYSKGVSIIHWIKDN